MSFQDLEGASKPSSAPKNGISAVAAGIFQINTAVAGFRRLVDTIGTSKDTSEHRQALQDARKRIGQLVKGTSTKLKSLIDANHDENPRKSAEEAKLARDFQAAIHDFQKAQKLAEEREATYAPSPSRSPLPTSSGAEENVKGDGDEEGRLLLWEQKRVVQGSERSGRDPWMPGGSRGRRRRIASLQKRKLAGALRREHSDDQVSIQATQWKV